MGLPMTFPPAKPAVGTSTDAITAAAGGGITNATQLTSRFNHVTTVATGADSVKLEPWAVDLIVYVANDGAAALAVFPYGNGLDKINSGAVAASVSIGAGKTGTFTGTGTAGRWHFVLSA